MAIYGNMKEKPMLLPNAHACVCALLRYRMREMNNAIKHIQSQSLSIRDLRQHLLSSPNNAETRKDMPLCRYDCHSASTSILLVATWRDEEVCEHKKCFRSAQLYPFDNCNNYYDTTKSYISTLPRRNQYSLSYYAQPELCLSYLSKKC